MFQKSSAPSNIPSPGETLLDVNQRKVFLAAAAHFARQGAVNPSYEELAGLSGVPVAKLRTMLPSLDGLLPATLTHISFGLGQGIMDATGRRSWEGLRSIADKMAALTATPGLFEFVCKCMEEGTSPNSPLHDWLMGQIRIVSGFIRTCIESGIADGKISPEINIDSVIHTVMPLEYGSGRYSEVTGGGYDIAGIMREYFDLLQFRYGIGPAAMKA